MKKYIYDLETFKSFFLATFKLVGKDKWLEFEISDRRNDIKQLREFLNTKPKCIGFNNISFDYPVLHNTILSNNNNWTAEEIFEEVQSIISSDYSAIWNKDTKVPQLDLYKIWHYDNMARQTSLKWLEFAMRMESIEDLPYEPETVLNDDQKDEVISYCRNDILATEMFYNKSLDNIQFRVNMTKELGYNVMNYSDVKIGEYINRKTYEKISKRNYYDFKKLRTYRKSFNVNDLIPDYITFKSDYLNNFLNEIRQCSFKSDEDFERHLTFAGIEIKFAKGGLHSVDTPRDIKCDDDHILQEKDVGSMYPASIINGKYYPRHLGKEWYMGIKQLFDERSFKLKPQLKKLKKGSSEYKYINSKQEAFKLAMNGGGYGKTGSLYSWQYDPMVIMKTTFKGQLSLLMLIEQLYMAGCKIISANTDGVVVYYNKAKKLEIDELHKQWEKDTQYILEDTNYSRIVFRDVNNYIAFIIDEDGNHLKYKFKGVYEIDRDYHKNHSKRIVALSAANYFINNIEPQISLKQHLNGYEYSFAENYGIYDFCIGSKMKGNNRLYRRVTHLANQVDYKLGKTNRYYVSKEGDQLIKILPPLEKNYLTKTDKFKEKNPNQMDIFDIIEDDVLVEPKNRETNIEAGWKCTLFNKYVDEEYDLSYNYYIQEINKLIDLE
jgi:hypothetical protein